MTYKLYDVLEVDRNATEDEIKKAYRKLAIVHHPDKNKGDPEADAKFKEISNAYSVLSNPETKNRYDMLGDENYNNESDKGSSDEEEDKIEDGKKTNDEPEETEVVEVTAENEKSE
jgi:DnaJ-class molecular chaperone